MNRNSSHFESLESRQLLSAGALDPSFNYDGKVTMNFGRSSGVATDVAVQADGKTIVVGGTNWDKPDNFRKDLAVVRFKSDGTLDPTFGPNHNGRVLTRLGDFADSTAQAVAVQPDGKIVVAGDARFDSLFGTHREFVIARYMPDGTLDTSFDGDGMAHVRIGENSYAADLALQKDGKIVVVGYSNTIGSFSFDLNFAVARFNPDGSLDRSFANTGARRVAFGDDEQAKAVAIDYSGTAASNPNYGKIVIAGNRFGDARDYFDVVRLNTNGAIDRSFGSGGERAHSFPNHDFALVRGMMIQRSGRIVVVGTAGDGGASNQFALTRYTSDGNLDPTFGTSGNGIVETGFGGNDRAEDIITSAAGGLIVSGNVDRHLALAGYSADGVLDRNFGDHGRVQVDDVDLGLVFGARIAVAPDRKFVVAGGRTFAAARFFDFPLHRASGPFDNVTTGTVVFSTTFSPRTFSNKLIAGLL
jgi:uncharacterized delta-60 repeat protein